MFDSIWIALLLRLTQPRRAATPKLKSRLPFNLKTAQVAGPPCNSKLIGPRRVRSIDPSLRANFVHQRKACRRNHCSCSFQKCAAAGIGRKFENHPENNFTSLCGRILIHNLATFNEGEVSVQFGLKHVLVRDGVRPVKMIADRKDYVASRRVGADDIYDIGLVYRHVCLSEFRSRQLYSLGDRSNASQTGICGNVLAGQKHLRLAVTARLPFKAKIKDSQ